MNDQAASEITPLLPVQRQSGDGVDSVPILPTVHSLENTDLTRLHWEDLIPHPIPAAFEADESKRLTFALVVLLQLRRQKILRADKSTDLYEHWMEEKMRTKDVEVLEMKLSEIWDSFLTQYHGSRELYNVLWSQYPLAHDKPTLVRVVDFLSARDAPKEFIAHPVISMIMDSTWRFGQSQGNPTESWILRCFNADAAPFKAHLLELLFDLTFLFLLLSYTIRPPGWPDSDFESQPHSTELSYSIREVTILVYAFSALASGQGAILVTSTLTILAFLLSLPLLPLPGSYSFSILLWVVCIRLLMYHVPTIHPGPLLLFEHKRSFPLATFLCKGLACIIRPLFVFYLPVTLVACFALSISLSGPLTGPLMQILSPQTFTVITRPDPPIVGAAPMDTRVVFLLLSAAVLLIILSSAYILGSSTPILHDQPQNTQLLSWGSYPAQVVHEARIASNRATLVYNTEYPFPLPFSLIELFFVVIPVWIARLLGFHQVKRATVAKFTWNITVRPFIAIITLLCWAIV